MTPMKRYALRAGAGLGALAVLAGGIFYFSGGYDRWSSGRLLTNACEGVLPVDGMRALLGDRNLESGEGTSEGSLDDAKTSLRVACDIKRGTGENTGKHTRSGSVTVSVNGVPTLDREALRYDSLYPMVQSSLPPVPLGRGWNGVFDAGSSREAKATTAVLLDCAPGRGDLLVTVSVDVRGYPGDTPLDNPERRTAYARIATDTAANASRRWNCDADLGEALRTVPLPVDEDEYVAPADAEGTCAGIPARGKSVTRAWESERSTALYEKCVLGGVEGRPTHEFAAHYGPYAEGARHHHIEPSRDRDPIASGERSGLLPGGSLWTIADCPGGGGPAFFTARPHGDDDKRSEAEWAYARSALKVFAERSAAAHHCSAPAAPTGPEKGQP
ncbi:hypothetical protein [Streptomyces sp. cmx-18-6]|uniref:hypothetical protein n=1 Tax=Streptomyces sp. cmx-18-6 TaxID=2790930 RepID=UPI00397ECBD0